MSWSTLPFELKTQVIEAYVDDTYHADGGASITYGVCPGNPHYTYPVVVSVRQPEHLESVAEKSLSNLYSALPEALQEELAKICANKLDALWATGWYTDQRQMLPICLFLLDKGVGGTGLFEFEPPEVGPRGLEITMYLKRPCPVHDFSPCEFEMLGGFYPYRHARARRYPGEQARLHYHHCRYKTEVVGDQEGFSQES